MNVSKSACVLFVTIATNIMRFWWRQSLYFFFDYALLYINNTGM